MKKLLCLIALAACAPGQIVTPTPSAPQLTVPLAATATFRVNILAEVDGEWERVSSGTAWIARNDVGSYLVTAGHVCDDDPDLRYTLSSQGGLEYDVEIERQHSEYDLCLLHTREVVGPALWLSKVDPVYDEPVAAVGAPLGIFACYGGSSVDQCGMAPISRGFYAGGTLVSMPMVGGNSGSAVFTASGVIGVLIEGYRGFDSASFIEALDHLRDFLD